MFLSSNEFDIDSIERNRETDTLLFLRANVCECMAMTVWWGSADTFNLQNQKRNAFHSIPNVNFDYNSAIQKLALSLSHSNLLPIGSSHRQYLLVNSRQCRGKDKRVRGRVEQRIGFGYIEVEYLRIHGSFEQRPIDIYLEYIISQIYS